MKVSRDLIVFFSALIFAFVFLATNVDATTNIGTVENRTPLTSSNVIKDAIAYEKDQLIVLTYEGNVFLYNESQNQWKEIKGNPLKRPQKLAVLHDGNVLIIGGHIPGKTAYTAYAHNVLLNVKTGKFQEVPSFPNDYRISDHPSIDAVTLKNGNVLVMGHTYIYRTYNFFAYEYNPTTNQWHEPFKINYVGSSIEMDDNGNILNYGDELDEGFLEGYYLKNGSTKPLMTSSMPHSINRSATTPLADGSFLLIGGSTDNLYIIPSNITQMFDPAKNEWREVKGMSTARTYADAALLPDGRVLVVGGYGNNGPLHSTEIYNPQTNTWVNGPNLTGKFDFPLIEKLGNGKFIVINKDNSNNKVPVNVISINSGTVQNNNGKNVAKEIESKINGVVTNNRKLFSKDGWTYREVSIQEVDPNKMGLLESEKDLRYSNKYLIREHEQTGKTEMVVNNHFTFLKLEGNTIYYTENQNLKKMNLGDRYGENILFPNSFRYDNDEKWGVLLYGGFKPNSPIQIDVIDFDGEYIFGWLKGHLPVRLHYTGQYTEPLSNHTGDISDTINWSQMEAHDDWVTYLGIDPRGYAYYSIVAAKKDGSISKEIATTNSNYAVHNGRIYYYNAKDPSTVGGTNSQGKLYSVNIDGSDNRPVSKGGRPGKFLFVKDGIVFNDRNSGKIMKVSYDGKSTETIADNAVLLDANDYYILYGKNDAFYKVMLPSMQQIPYKTKDYYNRIRVFVNGEYLELSHDPLVISNHTMVPMKELAESLRVNITMNNKTITAQKGSTTITLTTNNRKAIVNGKEVNLSQAPVEVNGTIYVPIRFVSESFGAELSWLSLDHSTYITFDEK